VRLLRGPIRGWHRWRGGLPAGTLRAMTGSQLPSPHDGWVADRLLELIGRRGDVVVGMGNGEPVGLMGLADHWHEYFREVRFHQMHALEPWPYTLGERPGMRHVAYFLGHPEIRESFRRGDCDLVPACFSDVAGYMHARRPRLVVTRVAPADADGWYSLGTQADYAASFIGQVPFAVEVDPYMPRTFGQNRIHASQVALAVENAVPLHEVEAAVPGEADRRIADLVAARVPNWATIQVGIGGIPNAVLELLRDRHGLSIHTELLTEGVVELVERGCVEGRVTATFALGSRRLYEWLEDNDRVYFLPAARVNDQRVIARAVGETGGEFVSINATTEVNLYGECASETIAGRYHSGAGGQVDFVRGSVIGGGHSFICLRSQTSKGKSRIALDLTPGSVVTTSKTAVDSVVTEWGIAELRGRTYRERAEALIAVAHPDHRARLEAEARERGLLPRRPRAVAAA
jgi:acyl-CoA hydrolase